ncbi:MAG: ATP synthase F1 subunit epsilon [Anaerolineaceae bacterium]|nr:ATP synthase F1 subunit epsilon [Anaerolineaceae bacterium]
MPIPCEIVSQDRIVFQGNVDIVVLPGQDGTIGILPNHSPVLTVLEYGVITVRTDKVEQYFTVAGGVAEVLPDHVTVLADAAENVEEIDDQRAQAAMDRAEELLSQKLDMDPDRYMAIQAALQRSTLRLNAVKKYRQRRRNEPTTGQR